MEKAISKKTFSFFSRLLNFFGKMLGSFSGGVPLICSWIEESPSRFNCPDEFSFTSQSEVSF